MIFANLKNSDPRIIWVKNVIITMMAATGSCVGEALKASFIATLESTFKFYNRLLPTSFILYRFVSV